MEMKPVTSSHIEAVGHNGNTIRVRYKGGTIYEGTCPPDKHQEIMGSDSVGAALHASGIKLTKVQ